MPFLKNCIARAIEAVIVEMAVEQPTFGQYESAHEFAKRGLSVSPVAVRRLTPANDLETTKEERLRALEGQ